MHSQGGLAVPRRSLDGSTLNSVTSTSFATIGTPILSFAELDGKDVIQQIEVLTQELEKARNIKTGAENLLQAHMQRNVADDLRQKLESALSDASGRMTAISNKIAELRDLNVRRPPRKSSASATVKTRKYSNQGSISSIIASQDVVDKDDYRTSLSKAASLVKQLAAFPRYVNGGTVSPGTPMPSTSNGVAIPSTEAELNRARVEVMNRLVELLEGNLRVRYEIDIPALVSTIIPILSDRSTREARAAAYRLLRHILVDSESVEKLREQELDWYIVRSLSRDQKHASEREQVIMLMRAMVEIGSVHRAPHAAASSGRVPISDYVIRALIAIAEHPEDPLRLICIETLAEIVLIDIDLISKTGGIHVLLQALSDASSEVGPVLAATFLYIADTPATRTHLHAGSDLELALSAITDAYGKGEEHTERIRACSRVACAMLRTWSGIFYFCMNNLSALRSIVDTLRIPSLPTREAILDMFFDLLNIKTPEWFETFITGRRLTMYRQTKEAEQLIQYIPPVLEKKASHKTSLTDQFIAFLVLMLMKAGLVDAIVSMFEETETGSALTRKATLLLGEILHISNRVLPLSIAAQIQSLPRVFELASDFNQHSHRIIGTSAMSSIDSFNRNRARLQPGPVKDVRARANSVEDSFRRVETLKTQMGMNMDDRPFQVALVETQVLMTKDHTKWNYQTLLDLVEGPLMNPKRLEEAVRGLKFMRRLMQFFHPFNHRFADIKITKTNMRWMRLGTSLMTTLLANPDGVRFLSTDDPFMGQIRDCFAQLDPFNGTPATDPIFSTSRIDTTLTRGYLEMLGVMSRNSEGRELLERFKIYTAWYHLSELRSRNDMVLAIVQKIDYSVDGHARIVLSKALTSSYMDIRRFSTQHLGNLVKQSGRAQPWMLRLLVTQLYDPASQVCEMAAQFLYEECEEPAILSLVVDMQPSLDHLGEIGHPLLLRFMSHPAGFNHLLESDYISREIDAWFHERNAEYVVQVEVYLSRSLSFSRSEAEADPTVLEAPQHFYGELAQTDLGCQVLAEKGHFQEFVDFIRSHGEEEEDFDIIQKLKSVLWAVGNIGATEGGLAFLEEADLIHDILYIAEESLVLSIRGTCFFVLGLISSTPQGAEILYDYGWEAALNHLGQPSGICIPVDVEKYISLPPWDEPATSSPERYIIPPDDPTEKEIMQAISNLANTVIANSASRTLARMKAKPENRRLFSSSDMYFRALWAISSGRYRLPVRRFVVELFDVQMDEETIRRCRDAQRRLIVESPPSVRPTHGLSLLGDRRRRKTVSNAMGLSESVLNGDRRRRDVHSSTFKHQPDPVHRIVGFDAGGDSD